MARQIAIEQRGRDMGTSARGLDRAESEMVSQVFIGSVKTVRASARRYQVMAKRGEAFMVCGEASLEAWRALWRVSC